MEPNPSWADKILREYWDRIEARVGAKRMPVCRRGPRGGILECKEFGEGHYGAVYPTSDPNVVFKITTDPSEAFFVKVTEQIGGHQGVVDYFGVYSLSRQSHRNRPVYVLWRQEANFVGSLPAARLPDQDMWELFGMDDWYYKQLIKQFMARLVQFRCLGNVVRSQLRTSKDPAKRLTDAKSYERWAWENVSLDDIDMIFDAFKTPIGSVFERLKGAQAVAAALRGCEIISEMMENENLADRVGGAFSYYLERGILVADVHYGNVGIVTRVQDGYEDTSWVITDPGHVISIRPEPWDVHVEEI